MHLTDSTIATIPPNSKSPPASGSGMIQLSARQSSAIPSIHVVESDQDSAPRDRDQQEPEGDHDPCRSGTSSSPSTGPSASASASASATVTPFDPYRLALDDRRPSLHARSCSANFPQSNAGSGTHILPQGTASISSPLVSVHTASKSENESELVQPRSRPNSAPRGNPSGSTTNDRLYLKAAISNSKSVNAALASEATTPSSNVSLSSNAPPSSGAPSSTSSDNKQTLKPVAMRPGMHRFHSSPVVPSMSPTRQHFRLPNPSPRPIKETYNASYREDASGRRLINHYVVDKEIGKGSYGSVRTAIDQDTNVKYALKEYSKQRLRKLNRSELMLLRRKALKGRSGQSSLEQENDQLNLSSKLNDLSNPLNLLRREIAIMKKLDHPNIVNLVEVLDDPHGDTLYVILEWCEKGTIMPRKHGEKPYYSEEQCRLLFRDMILGVEFLHSQCIMHRDIKADNILVNEEDVVKLVDFGVSEIFEQDNDTIKKTAGSPAYMAPELVKLILKPFASPSLGGQEIPLTIASPPDQQSQTVSGRAADIWSLGVTLYYMRYGYLPFTGETVPDLYENIVSKEPDFSTEDDGTPNPSSDALIDLLQRILDKNPRTRITMVELREHPWVTCNGEDPLLSREENSSALIEPVTEEDIMRAIELIEGKMDLNQATEKLRKFHGWRGDLVESAQQSRESSRSPNNHFRTLSGDQGPNQFKLTRALNEIISKNSSDDPQNKQQQRPFEGDKGSIPASDQTGDPIEDPCNRSGGGAESVERRKSRSRVRDFSALSSSRSRSMNDFEERPSKIID